MGGDWVDIVWRLGGGSWLVASVCVSQSGKEEATRSTRCMRVVEGMGLGVDWGGWSTGVGGVGGIRGRAWAGRRTDRTTMFSYEPYGNEERCALKKDRMRRPTPTNKQHTEAASESERSCCWAMQKQRIATGPISKIQPVKK